MGSPWGHKESDSKERLSTAQHIKLHEKVFGGKSMIFYRRNIIVHRGSSMQLSIIMKTIPAYSGGVLKLIDTSYSF